MLVDRERVVLPRYSAVQKGWCCRGGGVVRGRVLSKEGGVVQGVVLSKDGWCCRGEGGAVHKVTS